MSLLTIFAGKQGRTANQPQDDPTTHVSPVNVHHQQQNRTHDHAPPPHNYANTDPNLMAHQAHQVPGGDAYSAADVDQRNRGAQAHNAAAHQAEKQQKKGKKVDQEELKRIVAEENESKGKLPRYPGLERWQLIEKMGDGAFSNVYRARDLDGEAGEVAIKVVRKFEMNSSQVSILARQSQHLF
jgi:serine/threonine-protein kinase RCK2